MLVLACFLIQTHEGVRTIPWTSLSDQSLA